MFRPCKNNNIHKNFTRFFFFNKKTFFDTFIGDNENLFILLGIQFKFGVFEVYLKDTVISKL